MPLVFINPLSRYVTKLRRDERKNILDSLLFKMFLFDPSWMYERGKKMPKALN